MKEQLTTLTDLLDEGTTIQEIVNELGVSYAYAKATIDKLMTDRDIHIIDWEYSSEGYVWTPVYATGTGYNKPMPRTDSIRPRRDWAVSMLFGNDVVNNDSDESGFGF